MSWARDQTGDLEGNFGSPHRIVVSTELGSNLGSPHWIGVAAGKSVAAFGEVRQRPTARAAERDPPPLGEREIRRRHLEHRDLVVETGASELRDPARYVELRKALRIVSVRNRALPPTCRFANVAN
jgi:hypothetical protein